MFKFKNISSEEMKVLVEEETNFIVKAPQKFEMISVDGRDGSLFNELGYADININIKCNLLKNSNIDAVLEWLNGTGELEYLNRITTARFYSSVEITRQANMYAVNFELIRSPFWLAKNDNFITVINKIDNLGNVFSTPIILLEKTTQPHVDLTVAGTRFKYNFGDENHVEIDCEELTAKFNGLLRNSRLEIGFDFPKLKPGENNVLINSGDAVIKVKRKDRWF